MRSTQKQLPIQIQRYLGAPGMIQVLLQPTITDNMRTAPSRYVLDHRIIKHLIEVRGAKQEWDRLFGVQIGQDVVASQLAQLVKVVFISCLEKTFPGYNLDALQYVFAVRDFRFLVVSQLPSVHEPEKQPKCLWRYILDLDLVISSTLTLELGLEMRPLGKNQLVRAKSNGLHPCPISRPQCCCGVIAVSRIGRSVVVIRDFELKEHVVTRLVSVEVL